MAEPRTATEAYRRHRAECAACAALARKQEDFERALTKAVEIDVPPNLGARLLLHQATQRSFPWKRMLAMAVSILVVLGVLVATPWAPRSPTIENVVMDHIHDEPQHLLAQDEIPRERAAAIMAEEGMTLRGDLGVIRFVARCPGRPGVHLVLAGTRGPVTVMIMPATPVASRLVLARSGLMGIVAPIEKGSLAVVGLPGEPIDEHEQRVRAAILPVAS